MDTHILYGWHCADTGDTQVGLCFSQWLAGKRSHNHNPGLASWLSLSLHIKPLQVEPIGLL
jgi:hypothetical protein